MLSLQHSLCQCISICIYKPNVFFFQNKNPNTYKLNAITSEKEKYHLFHPGH